MGKMRFFFRNVFCICVPFFVSLAAVPRAEGVSPESALQKGITPIGLDYPDNAALKHAALIPLSGYTTEKGKALAQRYRAQLVQIVMAIEKDFPLSQMEVRAVGFLKSPQSGQKDDRYLSVIVEVSEEYDPGKTSLAQRAGAIFNKYIASLAKILLQRENILGDKDVEGIAICPNWMLKQTKEASSAAAMSEGMFVCLATKAGNAFLHNKIDLNQLATQAKIYARQGDTISPLSNLQLEKGP